VLQEASMTDTKYFATLSLQVEISRLSPILSRHGVDNFSIYILFKTGEVFLLSSVIKLCLPYYEEKMYEQDRLLDPLTHKGKLYHLGTDACMFGENEGIITSLSGGNIHYYIVRECCDFTIILSAAGKKHYADRELFYKQSSQSVASILSDFIFRIRPILFDRAPGYKHSRFLNDQSLLSSLLTNKLNLGTRLFSDRECEVLNLSAKGKTAEEISIILAISPRTVHKYRLSIMEKLNCSNITHSVFEATKRGIISESCLSLKKFDFSQRFVNTDII